MAIVNDPTDLDRWEVCVNAEGSTISVRGLDTERVAFKNDGTSDGGIVFHSTTAAFVTNLVVAGDILTIISGADAAHYIVAADATSETNVDLETAVAGSATTLTFKVNAPKAIGGLTANTADGVTMQALYSFLKEEWRDLSVSLGNAPDLIQFVFPLESITREQFEIGGTTHGSWDFYDDITRQLMRTGGWAQISSGGTTESEYSGIITLGSVDSTAQVYYQQTNTVTSPVNFVLTGPVNQAILTYDGTTDWRTYLKLFVRTKARTYEQSQISDIGVTALETIVNRFPLAHSVDVAITATDGALITTIPYTSAVTTVKTDTSGGAEGITDPTANDGLFLFTHTGAFFDSSNEVFPGDSITFNDGPHSGSTYEIESVTDTDNIVCFQEPAEDTTADVATNYTTETRYIVIPGTTDGVNTDDTTDDTIGELTSGTIPDFSAAGVAAGDMIRITEGGTAGTSIVGIYKVDSLDGTATLKIDITDNENWAVGTGIDFEIVEPGMYLQYKDATGVTVTAAAGRTLDFDTTADEITASTGSFISDGYEVGMAVTVGGGVATNSGSTFTISTLSATVMGVNENLADEGPLSDDTTTLDGDGGFYRDLGGTTYPFHWRLFGNSGNLGQCFQYIQRQLRRITDIDEATGASRGDVTDLLMTFASPTGVTLDMFIDDLDSGDFNNATFNDVSGSARNYPFVAGVTITLNSNITTSTDCKVVVFFSNDDAPGDNLGYDFGTPNAIIIQDTGLADMTAVNPNTDLSFSFDYDNNVQRGSGSGDSTADITIVAIGTDLAQYVQTTGVIKKQNVNTFALVSPLERNYSNP